MNTDTDYTTAAQLLCASHGSYEAKRLCIAMIDEYTTVRPPMRVYETQALIEVCDTRIAHYQTLLTTLKKLYA